MYCCFSNCKNFSYSTVWWSFNFHLYLASRCDISMLAPSKWVLSVRFSSVQMAIDSRKYSWMSDLKYTLRAWESEELKTVSVSSFYGRIALAVEGKKSFVLFVRLVAWLFWIALWNSCALYCFAPSCTRLSHLSPLNNWWIEWFSSEFTNFARNFASMPLGLYLWDYLSFAI